MKKTMAWALALAGCVALTAAACGDDDDDSTPANNAAAGSSAAGSGGSGTAGSSTAGSGGSDAAGSGGSDAAGAGGSDAAGSGGSAGNDGTGTGPGSSLKCKSSGKNAFETYGSAFGAVNDAIIGNVAAELGKGGEPGFGPTFGPVAADPNKLATLKTNLADFLVFAYGGPNNYKGKSMKDAHAGLAITQAQYDYFLVNVVVKALTDKGVPQDDIDSCFAPPLVDKAFVADIVTAPDAAKGPGASLKCDSSGKNAFETYGLDAFVKVNDSIIGNVAAELGKGGEPGFGPTFGPVAADQAKLDALKGNLANFLVFAYGGPNNYKGKSMKDAHAGLAITQAQYDYFLTNVVVKALTDNGVPAKDVETCFAPPLLDKTFIADIVTVP